MTSAKLKKKQNKAMMKANISVSEDARREQQQPTKANQTRECAHFLFLSHIKVSSFEDVTCPQGCLKSAAFFPSHVL